MESQDNSKKETQRLLKVKQLMESFNSGEYKQMSKALKSLQIHGDESIIMPILNKWNEGVNEDLDKQIIEFLSSLKSTETTASLMEAVEDKKFRSKRQLLLNTIWNTKVDFSDYLEHFVEIAIEGDFMETLECLTIIENLEGPFMEEQMLEAKLHLKNYLEKGKTTNIQKAELLSEIVIKLKDFEEDMENFV